MEGRDIGTVVLPDVPVKIFLTASIDERARRRFEELKEKSPEFCPTYEEVRAEVAERDRLDEERATSPLRAADDAIIVTTDGFSIVQVVDKIVDIAKKCQK